MAENDARCDSTVVEVQSINAALWCNLLDECIDSIPDPVYVFFFLRVLGIRNFYAWPSIYWVLFLFRLCRTVERNFRVRVSTFTSTSVSCAQVFSPFIHCTPRKICFKHTTKTKILPPKNAFPPNFQTWPRACVPPRNDVRLVVSNIARSAFAEQTVRVPSPGAICRTDFKSLSARGPAAVLSRTCVGCAVTSVSSTSPSLVSLNRIQ